VFNFSYQENVVLVCAVVLNVTPPPAQKLNPAGFDVIVGVAALLQVNCCTTALLLTPASL
jgi:hypothetical protein